MRVEAIRHLLARCDPEDQRALEHAVGFIERALGQRAAPWRSATSDRS